jgi:hypothetical protein
MKRSWIGLALLLVLLVISLAVTGFMTRIHEDLALDLRQSAESALLGDWDNVQLFLRRANRSWTKWGHLRASFADHKEVEAVDAALASLEIWRQSKDAAAYRAACAALTKQVEALGEAHKLTWWNVF